MSRTMQGNNDADLELSWSKDAVFATPQIASMPEEPGLFVLVRGGGSDATQPFIVWAEAPDDLRFRARELAGHATVGPELGAILQHADLRFRYAVVHDPIARHRAIERLREQMPSASDEISLG